MMDEYLRFYRRRVVLPVSIRFSRSRLLLPAQYIYKISFDFRFDKAILCGYRARKMAVMMAWRAPRDISPEKSIHARRGRIP